jgi:hypothetical protein
MAKDEKYVCECGGTAFEIMPDRVVCATKGCGLQFKIGVGISPARFNADKHKVIIVEPVENSLKTGRTW